MKKLLNKKMIKRVLAIYLIAIMVVVRGASFTYAVPTAPTAPTAPTYEEPAPTAPEEPTAPIYEGTVPEAPAAPVYGESEEISSDTSSKPESPSVSPTPSPTPKLDTTSGLSEIVGSDAGSGQTSSDPTPTPSVTPSVQSTGGQDDSGNMGSASISTGNASNTGAIVNTGAENVLTTDADGNPTGGIVIKNTGNGSGTTNTGSATLNSSDTKTQVNTTNVANNMDSVADSGHNEADKNMGDAQVLTGDANVTGTIINSVNTNIDGIMVSEFNVVDDHVGDIVLNFAEGCISNCQTGGIAVVNSGNGSDSTNTGTVVVNDNDITFQQNDANVENNMVLTANTGANQANKNMGEASIATGDANVEANIINMVNNNIAGDVVYAVVNIFGDLVGDIIIPIGMLEALNAGSDITVANTGNNSGSTNTANVDINQSDNFTQINNALVDNNLNYEANTGSNNLEKVMNGDTAIKTGDAEIVAQVLNIVNTNIIGGNAWLVIVNEAGKWIGKIIGGDGSNLAGSEGFEFIVNDAGDILAVNEGNGSGSTNTTNVTVNDNDSFTQINNANVTNNVTLNANTGRNETEKNMGGSNIQTGDAKIIANIVNFVNNNIIGTGKLFVTVVNVFGNWKGNVVPPGYEKESETADNSGIGGGGQGDSNQGGGSGSSSSGSSGSSSSGSSSDDGGSAASVVAAIFTKPKVFGTGIGGGELLAEAAMDEASNESAVAGAMDENKKVTINLAYALLGIPLIPGFFFAKKKWLLLRAASGK